MKLAVGRQNSPNAVERTEIGLAKRIISRDWSFGDLSQIPRPKRSVDMDCARRHGNLNLQFEPHGIGDGEVVGEELLDCELHVGSPRVMAGEFEQGLIGLEVVDYHGGRSRLPAWTASQRGEYGVCAFEANQRKMLRE